MECAFKGLCVFPPLPTPSSSCSFAFLFKINCAENAIQLVISVRNQFVQMNYYSIYLFFSKLLMNCLYCRRLFQAPDRQGFISAVATEKGKKWGERKQSRWKNENLIRLCFLRFDWERVGFIAAWPSLFQLTMYHSSCSPPSYHSLTSVCVCLCVHARAFPFVFLMCHLALKPMMCM